MHCTHTYETRKNLVTGVADCFCVLHVTFSSFRILDVSKSVTERSDGVGIAGCMGSDAVGAGGMQEDITRWLQD